MLNQNFIRAKEEFKRIDHLIYVTLKYTRTVDVIRGVLEREISTYEFLVDSLLESSDSVVMDASNNTAPLKKINQVLALYSSDTLKKNMEHYLFLRKIRRSDYKKANEYRRNVSMTVMMDGEEKVINIDSVTEDFNMLKHFLDYVQEILEK